MFSTEGFLFDKDVYILGLNMPDDALVAGNYPASTAYIDVSGFERFAFLAFFGALDTETTLQVRQDTSATQTANIKDVTGALITVAATGDDRWYLIEVQQNQLDSNNDFRYVTLAVGGAAGANDTACIFFFGVPTGRHPVTQPTGSKGKGSAVALVG